MHNVIRSIVEVMNVHRTKEWMSLIFYQNSINTCIENVYWWSNIC